jgi:hypothetical protein
MNEEELIRALEEGNLGNVYTLEEYVEDLKTALCDARKQLKNAIPIPDNATNGDMIKTITGEDFSRGASIYNHDLMICDGEYYLAFNVDWWNAPYKKED